MNKLNFLEFIRQLIQSHTKESSKRFIALGTMGLVTYVVVRFTTHKNAVLILGELLSFVLILVGVSIIETVKLKNKEV